MTIPQWMLEASFILIIATPALAWVAYLGLRAFERWRYPLYRARLSPPVRIGHTNHVHVAGMDDEDDDEDDEGFETPRYSHPRGEEGKFDPTDPYEHSVIRNIMADAGMIDPNEIEVEDEGEDEFDDGSVDYGSDPAALRRTEASPEEVDPVADLKAGIWVEEIQDLQGQLRSAGYQLVALPEFADDGTYWEHPHGDQVAMQVTKDFARIWVFTRKGGMYEFEEYVNEHSKGQE